MNTPRAAEVSTCKRCACCPYGLHVDSDFIKYCETLLQHVRRSSSSSRITPLQQSGQNHNWPRETRSLPRRSASYIRSESLTLNCDCSMKTGTSSNSSLASEPRATMGHFASRSISLPCDDASLNEVVEKFEEVLREQKRKVQRSRGARRLPDSLAVSSIQEDFGSFHMDSPPASPASEISSSATTPLSRDSYTAPDASFYHPKQQAGTRHMDDQMSLSALLKHKLAMSDRMKASLADCANNNSTSHHFARQEEIAGTYISSSSRTLPKQHQRHSLSVFTSIANGTSNDLMAANKKGVDVCLQADSRPPSSMSVGTNYVFKEDTMDAAVLTDRRHCSLSTSVLDGISIPSELDKKMSTSTRSIGISTNFAPSLPRKRNSSFTISSYADVEKISHGTDPMEVDLQATSSQTESLALSHKSTSTDSFIKAVANASCNATVKTAEQSAQTDGERKKSSFVFDQEVQVSSRCAICEVKQTETVGVECNIIEEREMVHKNEMTDHADFAESAELEEIKSLPGESARRLSSSDEERGTSHSGTISKIPRFASSPQSPKAIRSNSDIIIEESTNEILVYRNPESLHEPMSPNSSNKHRAFLPQMMSKPDGQLEESCRIESDDSDSESCSSVEGAYDVETSVISRSAICSTIKKKEISAETKAALKVLNDSLQKPDRATKSATAKSIQIIEKEWFKVASVRSSDCSVVEHYLDTFESFSKQLLNYIVNIVDDNGNTAMHYAISHSDFDAVSVLLDSKVCDVNKQNNAGYSAVMLVSLAKVSNETQKAVIRRLFQLSDVNLRAKQNGQTAMMLAASHGQLVTCKLLIEAGAALNVQDNDGSTALMCASEHGQLDIVRLLLCQPDCDPNITDNDGSTALSISMESGNKDIGLALYASSNMFSRGSTPYASLRRSQSKAATTSMKRTGSLRVRPPLRNEIQFPPSPPARKNRNGSSAAAAPFSPSKK